MTLASERIVEMRVSRYRLPLRFPWVTHQGSWSQRFGWLIQVRLRNDTVGFGDCAPLPAAGTESALAAKCALDEILRGCIGVSVGKMLVRLHRTRDVPAAVHGVSTALLDALCRNLGCSLAGWLNPQAANHVSVNAALGGLDQGLAERIQDAVDSGFRVLKVKVAVGPVQDEMVRLQELAQVLPVGVKLRLDANRGWTKPQARWMMAQLRELPIESIEEPLQDPDSQELCALQSMVPWPLALDESLSRYAELLFKPGFPVQRIVLKPMRRGDPGFTLALARQARELGIESIVTTTLESAVGVHGCLQVAAALNNEAAHGLATNGWLRRDVASPARINEGQMTLPSEPGLGIWPGPEVSFGPLC